MIAEALVWHKGSSTFKREGSKLQRYFDARNIPRLLLRHGGGGGRRPAWRAWGHFLRYAYHRYALEREAGFTVPADAVVDGLYDAAARRFGGYQPPGSRPGVGPPAGGVRHSVAAEHLPAIAIGRGMMGHP